MDRSEILQRFERGWIPPGRRCSAAGIPEELLGGDAAPEESHRLVHHVGGDDRAHAGGQAAGPGLQATERDAGAGERSDAAARNRWAPCSKCANAWCAAWKEFGAPEDVQPGFWDRIFRRALAPGGARARRGARPGRGLSPEPESSGRFAVSVSGTAHRVRGQPFDPRRMNAVDVEETDRAAGGHRAFWSTARATNGMASCTGRRRSGWPGGRGTGECNERSGRWHRPGNHQFGSGRILWRAACASWGRMRARCCPRVWESRLRENCWWARRPSTSSASIRSARCAASSARWAAPKP